MILKVPIEYLPDFIRIPTVALRQYGNFASTAFDIFYYNWANIQKCYRGSNPFNEHELLFDKDYRCKDGFTRFGHIDLSISGDACGVCICHISNFVHIPSANVEGDVEKRELFPFINIDFLGRIFPKNQAGGVLDPALIRETCIFELLRRGFDIGLVTFDGFQSWESILRCREKGIASDFLSIDNTKYRVVMDFDKEKFVRRDSLKNPTAPHDLFREILADFRVNLPIYKFIEVELKEQDAVDGLVVKIQGGTDDVIQAAVGAIFNAVNNTFEFVQEKKNRFDESEFMMKQKAQNFREMLGEQDRTTRETDKNVGDQKKIDHAKKTDAEKKYSDTLDQFDVPRDTFGDLLGGNEW